MAFFLIGLNHITAPVGVREKFSHLNVSKFPGVDGRNLEAITLSTCNRVEAYFSGNEDDAERLFKNWLRESGFLPEECEPYLYRHRNEEVVFHLLKVASGLDSMVLGEGQILHQSKESYQNASEAGSVGKSLHALFQKALEVGKRVRSETRISENTVSIASTAVELARSIFEPLNECAVLVVGAGEMASLVALHMKDRGGANLLFVNRTFKRAEELAEVFGGKAFPFDQLSELLVKADIVVSSTGASLPIITNELLGKIMEQRPSKPLFAIDIAVPRDIEASCQDLENVFLYNIDDLQGVVDENMDLRKIEAEKALAIVKEETGKFQNFLNTFSVVPLIRSLRDNAERIRKAELEKFFPSGRGIDSETLNQVEQLTRALMAKWLHHPILALKEKSSGSRENLATLGKVFGLPEDSFGQTPIIDLSSRRPPSAGTN